MGAITSRKMRVGRGMGPATWAPVRFAVSTISWTSSADLDGDSVTYGVFTGTASPQTPSATRFFMPKSTTEGMVASWSSRFVPVTARPSL